MLSYEPDDTVAHRLDPRSKLAVQIGFAVAALAAPTPRRLAALTLLALLALWSARVPLRRALAAVRFALVVLAAAPVVAALSPGPPWIEPTAAVDPALASYRVGTVLLVSAAYVRSTPIRDSQAAIRWAVPGKVGRLLAVGVGLVLRFLPLLVADLRTIREASAARLGDRRGVVDRLSRVATLGLSRAFARADRLALALQARCFAWNPTVPGLAFSRLDVPACLLALALALSALW